MSISTIDAICFLEVLSIKSIQEGVRLLISRYMPGAAQAGTPMADSSLSQCNDL